MPDLEDLDDELEDDGVLPATVGLLLWRPAPGGREWCVIDLEGRTVLPKGVLRQGEDERDAALRLARDLCDGRTSDAEPIAPPPGGRGAVAWWRLRWTGPTDTPQPQRRAHLRWLSHEQAKVELTRRFERELARAERRPHLARLVAWLGRERSARAARERWELEDQRSRVQALPDGHAGPGVPSWRARALTLLQRSLDSQALGDAAAARDARAEARRLELFGHSPEALAALRVQLAGDAEELLEGSNLDAAQALLAPPARPDQLARAACLLDNARAAQDDRTRAAREERANLGSTLALALLALWLFADGSWFSSEAGAESADLYLSVALFGLMGGAVSALLSPRTGLALLRPLIGAVSALLLYALVASKTLSLGALSPGGWVLIAFAAGFAERWVTRPRS